MKRIYYFLAAMTLYFVSCEAPPNWYDEVEDLVPDNVIDVSVKNTNGGAVIHFAYPPLPEEKEEDRLGIKATYTLTNGDVKTKYASVKVDSIVLEGFGDTKEYTVNLQTMHKSGNLSNGYPVTIQPEMPPIFLIRESLDCAPAFGGINFTWENPEEKDVRLSLYTFDQDNKDWVFFDYYYSNSKQGKTNFRGLDPEEIQFKLEISDRWRNFAEPLEASLVPLEEVPIASKSGSSYVWSIYDQANYSWRGDIYNDQYSGRSFSQALEGRAPHNDANTIWNPGGDLASLNNYIGQGTGPMPFPLYVTIDMGRKAFYTRMNIHSRLRSPSYSAALPIDFDIWGSNAPKPLAEIGDKTANLSYWTCWPIAGGTDAWKEDGTWTHIGKCRIILADGSSKYVVGMTLAAEDLYKYEVDGFEFEFDHLQAYRYLRWQIHETNTGQNILHIVGIRFWGQYAE